MGISNEIKDLKRLEQILSILVKYEMGYYVDKLKLKHLIPVHLRIQKKRFENNITKPKVICEAMEELGGAFIKLGQILSLRPDLIPEEYCNEFKRLQDKVKPYSGKIAKEIVKKELNKNKKKFAYFNINPIASGSIAQVHEAILNNTKKVVVKVQRPDAQNTFKTDIEILYYLAKLYSSKHPNSTINAVEIVKEFEKYTNDEFDFVKEGKNIEQFNENFKTDKTVKIPEVYKNYSTKKVLTMEYIHGRNIEKLKTAPYRKRKALAKKVIEIIFKQIFVDGFFHADPHPGNIFVLKNDVIALLDFGIVGRMNPQMRQSYIMLVSGLTYKDSKRMTEALVKLHFSKQIKVDKEKLELDLETLIEDYFNVSLNKMNVGIVLNEIIKISKQNNLKLPTDFVLLGKSLVTVEGFCAELDPKFNVLNTLRPFVNGLKKKEFDPKFLFKKTTYNLMKLKELFFGLPDMTTEVVEEIRDVDQKITGINNNIKSLNSNMTHSVDIIALVMLTVGFLLASVMMINFGEPFIAGIPVIPFIGFIATGIFMLILAYSMVKQIGK